MQTIGAIQNAGRRKRDLQRRSGQIINFQGAVMNGHTDQHRGFMFIDRGNNFLWEGVNIRQYPRVCDKGNQNRKKQTVDMIRRNSGHKKVFIRQGEFFLQIKSFRK